MTSFQESHAKSTIRALLSQACSDLQRSGLTYMGLPGAQASDLRELGSQLENAICIDKNQTVLDEIRRAIATLPLIKKRFVNANVWHYLRDQYQTEPLLADIAFLDFCGGGIHQDDPFAVEIAGLRNYFARHAMHQSKSFVFAWTYMPHDRGAATYVDVLKKMATRPELLAAVKRCSGVWLRSAAVRVLLYQSLQEHAMIATVFHHAVYKRSMNTIIVVFSRGVDPNCRLQLEAPETLLSAAACVYEKGKLVPRLVPVLDL